MIRKSLRKQKGVTLIELMIALTIGLILLMALSALMMVANRSASQRSTAEMMDESARQVFSRLERGIYHAGYVDSFQDEEAFKEAFDLSNDIILRRYARQNQASLNYATTTLMAARTKGETLPLVGCNTNFSNDNPALSQLNDAVPGCNTSAAPSSAQSIQFAYQAVKADSAGNFSSIAGRNENVSSGAYMSCTGQNATGNQPILVERYFLQQANGENNSSLFCDSGTKNFAGSSDAAREQPSVTGIDQLVFRYLVTAGDNSGANNNQIDFKKIDSGRSVVNYLHANQVENNRILAPLGWASVVGVEVCVVVAAEPLDGRREINIPEVQPNRPNCLRVNDGNEVNSPWANDLPRTNDDTRLYRRYTRTISMPNVLYLRF